MPAAAKPVNGATNALGMMYRRVRIDQVVPDRGIVIVDDEMGFTTQIPYRVQPGRGRLPKEGDYWYVDRAMGPWTLASYIATDDADLSTFEDLTVTGDLVVAGDITGSGSMRSYTCAWTTTTGLHTPAYGNAAKNFEWVRSGPLVFLRFEVTFGTTTSFGSGATSSDNWQFSLPVPGVDMYAMAGTLELSHSAGANCLGRVQIIDGTSFLIGIASGRVDATAITSTGAVDALSPWTWASGDSIRGSLCYVAAP